jgi:D-sedoheptulose 7-phosphate isomerase
MERIQKYISHLQGVLERLSLADVRQSIDLVVEAYQADRQIFVIGNGGSASTASHLACDLGKGTSLPGKRRFRVVSLTDNVATMTAWANDACYEDVFVEQLKNLVNPGDLVIGISASGNSENVVRAIRYARNIGCKTVSWTGFGGGKLAQTTEVSVVVDSSAYGPVEDVHLILNHVLHAWIRDGFADELADQTSDSPTRNAEGLPTARDSERENQKPGKE